MRISLNNIRNTKSLYIEEIGSFTVRKLGAGEELDLSDKLQRLSEILKELNAIDFTKFDTTREDGIKELNKISKKADTLTKELNEIQRFELMTYKKCFSDDNNGKNVDELLDSLSIQDRVNLFKTLFDAPQAAIPADEPQVEAEPIKEIKTSENKVVES